MTERRKDILVILALFVILVLFFSKILFTDKIIRAPDIISEAYWWMKGYNDKPLSELYSFDLKAAWDLYINSGHTNDGGMASIKFLLHLPLILHFIPAPASVAWFIVLHLFFGSAGVYCCCRLIGTSRLAALLGGLIFSLATENASLINAGHVMKIATIAYAPWAFYCLEKGFISRRMIWFMATAMVLAFQFFNTHWQISFYTCLCVGAYGLLRSIAIITDAEEQKHFSIPRLMACNLVVLAFFLSTVSISLAPLANWSKETNRGVQSGANQGKGGLDREEAMSWSMPPEETIAFFIPGFFGLSRQEAGPNPDNINSYYWGRMIFTQTASYFGLLPWLLLPLPLIFRRDKFTWLALLGVIGGILFSMGKYTPFYNFLFDFFPGIDRFRVPKMMMFIPVISLGILSARGLDLLLDRRIREHKGFNTYLAAVVALPVTIMLFLGLLHAGKLKWIEMLIELLSEPTRYEAGPQLVMQRWHNMLYETGLAAAAASICALLIVFVSKWREKTLLVLLLICVYAADVWRVDSKFMFLVDAPPDIMHKATPAMEFIIRDTRLFRTLPMDGGDPMHYVANRIPVLYTSNAVQQRRWQETLDILQLDTAVPDMLNLKYLVYNQQHYRQEQAKIPEKYQPVFTPADGNQIVLENRSVLPKAWFVEEILQLPTEQALKLMQTPQFNPARIALVETPPPFSIGPGKSSHLPAKVMVSSYKGEHISLAAETGRNALLVLGEKYSRGWKAYLDGQETDIVPVNHILRGVYLTPGKHKVEFVFDPLPFKIGKYITLASFALFLAMLLREWRKAGTGTVNGQRL